MREQLSPQQPAVSQSSLTPHAQFSFRPAAVPRKIKPVFHKAQIPAYAFTEAVEFMYAEVFEEFPNLQRALFSTVKFYHLHVSLIVATPVLTNEVQG